jgi:hypothetical protein
MGGIVLSRTIGRRNDSCRRLSTNTRSTCVHHTYTGVLYISYRSDKSTVLMRVGWELGI